MKHVFVTALVLSGLVAGCAGGIRHKSEKVSTESIRILFEQGRYAEVIDACSREGVMDADLYLLRGQSHRKMGDVNAAMADFRKVRAESPDRGEAYCREANLLVTSGKLSEALAVMHQAEMRLTGMSHRERFLVRAVIGEIYLAGEDAESAMVHLHKAITIGDASPFQNPRALSIVWHNLSQAEFELSSFRSARNSYDRYLRGKGQAGEEISPEDRYTEMSLRLLTGDIKGAQEIASGLPGDLRKHADSLLVGDALSVRELVDSDKERR